MAPDEFSLADHVHASSVTNADTLDNLHAADLALVTHTHAGLSTDGWIADSNTWAYASATTFTVPGDQRAIFTAGVKIKFTQDATVKCFHVASSAYTTVTTVTIIRNTAGVISTSAISANCYSLASNPIGFPNTFFFPSTWTAQSGTPALGNGTQTMYYSISGKMITVNLMVTFGSTSTYATASWLYSLPIAAPNEWVGAAWFFDTGVRYYTGVTRVSGASLEMYYNSTTASVGPAIPFTWGNTDRFVATVTYALP
jgi:hypothetical protein